MHRSRQYQGKTLGTGVVRSAQTNIFNSPSGVGGRGIEKLTVFQSAAAGRARQRSCHAFTRGQYEKTNPSNIIGDPMHFFGQLTRLWEGIVEEFSWVYVFLALVPFVFFFKLHRRERAWLIGITAIYLCMGVLLMILLNPPPDKQAQQLVRVFFTASHVLIALLVGYGLTLVTWREIGAAFAASPPPREVQR